MIFLGYQNNNNNNIINNNNNNLVMTTGSVALLIDFWIEVNPITCQVDVPASLAKCLDVLEPITYIL